jgi:DnaJ-class molecular chaperone
MILNEGEVICDKCNGAGTIWHGFTCQNCYGTGKLDWVTNAMGNSGGIKWGIIKGQQTFLRSYHGTITIGEGKGVSGTTYPIGKAAKPVNNLADAKKIARERGLEC